MTKLQPMKRLGIWNTVKTWGDIKCPTIGLTACESNENEAPNIVLTWLHFNMDDNQWYAENYEQSSVSHDLYTWILYRVEENKVLLYNKCNNLFIYTDGTSIRMNSHIGETDGVINPNYQWTISMKKDDSDKNIGLTLQCNGTYLGGSGLNTISQSGGNEQSFIIVPRIEIKKNRVDNLLHTRSISSQARLKTIEQIRNNFNQVQQNFIFFFLLLFITVLIILIYNMI